MLGFREIGRVRLSLCLAACVWVFSAPIGGAAAGAPEVIAMPRANAQPPDPRSAPLPVVSYPTPAPVTIDPTPSVSIPARQDEETIIYQYINNGWWGLDAHARYHAAPSYLLPELEARRAARLREDGRDPLLSHQDTSSFHPRRSSGPAGNTKRLDDPTGRQPSAVAQAWEAQRTRINAPGAAHPGGLSNAQRGGIVAGGHPQAAVLPSGVLPSGGPPPGFPPPGFPHRP